MRIRVRMVARAIDEPHRAASQLELLFDLTFVIAVAAITAQFAHGIADGHGLAGLVPFLQVFFAIWWAWMNFTWFASSYDTDDVAYRLLTLVQMAGVLVLAAGVPAAADHSDYGIVTLGYVIMRIGLVVQWLRAGREDPAGRRTALRYAAGITIAQLGWVAPLLPRGHRRPARVVRPAALPLPGRPGAGGAPVGGAGADHQLAPAPHRRALRPVHDHSARRERAGRETGSRRSARSGPRSSGPFVVIAVCGSRPAVRSLVALLPHRGGGSSPCSP